MSWNICRRFWRVLPRTFAALSSLPLKDPKTGTFCFNLRCCFKSTMAAIHPMRKVRGLLPAQRCFVFRLPNTLLCHTVSIIAIAVLVCCFLCSQLFALPLANSLQLVNHHFTLLIFFVEAQPHTREANAPLHTRHTINLPLPPPPLLVGLSGEHVIFNTDPWKYEGSTYGRESTGVSAEHYEKRRRQLRKLGMVRKNHSPATTNNVNEISVRWDR